MSKKGGKLFSTDNHLVCYYEKDVVILGDLSEKNYEFVLDKEISSMCCIENNTNILCFGTKRGNLIFYDVKSKSVTQTLKVRETEVNPVSIKDDIFFTGSDSRLGRVIKSFGNFKFLDQISSHFSTCSISKWGEKIISAGKDGFLTIYSLKEEIKMQKIYEKKKLVIEDTNFYFCEINKIFKKSQKKEKNQKVEILEAEEEILCFEIIGKKLCYSTIKGTFICTLDENKKLTKNNSEKIFDQFCLNIYRENKYFIFILSNKKAVIKNFENDKEISFFVNSFYEKPYFCNNILNFSTVKIDLKKLEIVEQDLKINISRTSLINCVFEEELYFCGYNSEKTEVFMAKENKLETFFEIERPAKNILATKNFIFLILENGILIFDKNTKEKKYKNIPRIIFDGILTKNENDEEIFILAENFEKIKFEYPTSFIENKFGNK